MRGNTYLKERSKKEDWMNYIVEPPDRRKWPLERGSRCREDLNKSQCMDFFVRPEIKKKKRGRCSREVAVSGGRL